MPLLSLKTTPFPITIDNIKPRLPIKINLLDLLSPPSPSPSLSTSDAQLCEDVNRDRIIDHDVDVDGGKGSVVVD